MQQLGILGIFNLQCYTLERMHILVDGLCLPQYLKMITGIVLLIDNSKLMLNCLFQGRIGVRNRGWAPGTGKPIPLKCISVQQ